ncbi:MAG: sulfite exporter TauE/SafE family protein [Tepidiformaceae bacterium]
MLEAAGLVLLGAAVGTFGTVVGAGGGFLLVPILLLIYPDESPRTITAISLFTVMLNAASGSIAYARQRRIDYRSGLLFAVATLPGAFAGAIVIQYIPRRAFAALFAAVLGSIGVYLLVRRAYSGFREPLSGPGVVHRRIRDSNNVTWRYSYRLWQGMLISVGVGFVSTLLGIGGGIVHMPIMAIVLHFPIHIAAATSQFVLGLMAVEGISIHFATGTLGWDENLGRAALLAAGAIPGAQVGAVIARRLPGEHIIRALGGSLLLVALRLGYTAITG